MTTEWDLVPVEPTHWHPMPTEPTEQQEVSK